ncbi:MAG: hypothetical protein K6E29_05045 [Cyanobacteria bacterium RUI128]|nr:hypothetical protein [Cyanobacteria bacterium RUI128]
MNYKEQFIKNKTEELTNRYKTVATLSVLSIINRDVKSVKSQYNELKNIYDEIMQIIENNCREEYYIAAKEFDFSILPDYLQSITAIQEYQNILALHYATTNLKNKAEYIQLNKMSIDFNPKEELPYFNIMKILYADKKYSEIIKMCEYLSTYSNSATIYSFMGSVYLKLKQYGKALRAFDIYTTLNQNDKQIENKIQKIYKEILK